MRTARRTGTLIAAAIVTRTSTGPAFEASTGAAAWAAAAIASTTIASSTTVSSITAAAIAAAAIAPPTTIRALETRARIAADACGVSRSEFFARRPGAARCAGFARKKDGIIFGAGSRSGFAGGGESLLAGVFVIVFMGAFGRAAFGPVSKTRGVNGVFVSGIGFGLSALARAEFDDLFRFFFGVFAFVGRVGYAFFDSTDFFAVFVADFNFFGLDGFYFLFFLLLVLFLVIELGATYQGVGWCLGLNVIVLGVHQTGGEGIDLLFAERSFRASLFGDNRFPCFMLGSHTGIVKRGGRILGGRRNFLRATGGGFGFTGSFGFGEQPARQSTGRTAWDIG